MVKVEDSLWSKAKPSILLTTRSSRSSAVKRKCLSGSTKSAMFSCPMSIPISCNHSNASSFVSVITTRGTLLRLSSNATTNERNEPDNVFTDTMPRLSERNSDISSIKCCFSIRWSNASKPVCKSFIIVYQEIYFAHLEKLDNN